MTGARRDGFWSGRRVLLTGHTGFKGSWLALWLQRLGADVVGLALEPEAGGSLYEEAHVEDGMTSVIGDIRDPELVRSVFERHRPEIVFHLAAQPLVFSSYESPVETFATNVLGTAHVLDAARTVGGVEALVVVTSDKCYENREWPWSYREIDPLGGHDPYSASKGCAEIVASSYRRSFFTDGGGPAVGSARAGNVIGGGDFAEHRLVPDAMRAFGGGQPLEVRSPGSVRPWQHVLDPLAGYLLLGERLVAAGSDVAEAWNFGPSDEDCRPVRWIVERLTGLWGEGASWSLGDDPPMHEATQIRLDCTKARLRLGWAPTLDLSTALEWTVEWHRARLEGRAARGVTLDQIDRYAGMLAAAEQDQLVTP